MALTIPRCAFVVRFPRRDLISECPAQLAILGESHVAALSIVSQSAASSVWGTRAGRASKGSANAETVREVQSG